MWKAGAVDDLLCLYNISDLFSKNLNLLLELPITQLKVGLFVEVFSLIVAMSAVASLHFLKNLYNSMLCRK
jgi:hypothetical protein